MTLEELAPALLVGAAIVLVSVLGVRLAGRLGVPGLLLYLVLGLLLGTFFPAMDLQDAELATVLGYTALVLILAQGGLTTRMSQLRPVMWPAITLASLGVGVSIAVVAIPLVLVFGVSTQNAILIGAVLAATDAAAVFSVMRRMRISSRVRTLLEAEAGFNDAPVVVLVSVVSSGAFDSTPYWQIPVIVLAELIGGAAVGIGVGYLARWVLPRLALPAVGLYPIAALALLVGAYGLADVIHVSGFLAVYVAAVLIGSAARLPHRRSIIGFADGLAWIAEIGLFVMLGALAEVSRLPPGRAPRARVSARSSSSWPGHSRTVVSLRPVPAAVVDDRVRVRRGTARRGADRVRGNPAGARRARRDGSCSTSRSSSCSSSCSCRCRS